MALSDKEISALYFEALGSQHLREQDRKMVTRFAHAVESEVRNSDEALIRQLVDALEQSQPYVESCANGKRVQWWGAQLDRAQDAINAARARLGHPCA